MGNAKRSVFCRETFIKLGIIPLTSELLVSLSFAMDNVKTANKSEYTWYAQGSDITKLYQTVISTNSKERVLYTN
jgi:hypothetical protein